MFNMYTASRKGFTIIEILVAIAILGLIVMVSIGPFVALKNTQALKHAVESTIAVLHEARAKTLASENATAYGVHIAPSTLTLFSGTTYSPSASDNITYTLDDSVSISNIALNGGATAVVFERLTGDTAEYGTFTIGLLSSSDGQKIITISGTGIISSS